MTTTSPDGEATPADPGAIDLDILIERLRNWRQWEEVGYSRDLINETTITAVKALRARVAELEDDGTEPYEKFQLAAAKGIAAETHVVALAGALKFYAAEGSWQWDTAPDPAGSAIPGSAPAECDHGNIAITALAATPEDVIERARAVEKVLEWARRCCDATNWVKAETTTAPGPGNELVSALARLDTLGKE